MFVIKRDKDREEFDDYLGEIYDKLLERARDLKLSESKKKLTVEEDDSQMNL